MTIWYKNIVWDTVSFFKLCHFVWDSVIFSTLFFFGYYYLETVNFGIKAVTDSFVDQSKDHFGMGYL